MVRMFVSYSRVDKPFVLELSPALRMIYGNDSTWVDDQIPGGKDWQQSIYTAIDQANIFLFLMSKDALESPNCQIELRYAWRQHKLILPIIVRPRTNVPGNVAQDLKPLLQSLQYVDMSTGAKDPQTLTVLNAAITQLILDPTPPPDPDAFSFLDTEENLRIREEMNEIQRELKEALGELRDSVGKHLKPHELKAIEDEFREINDIVDGMKSGLVRVALFGKTSVGKSAIANALIGDDKAKVSIVHGTTTTGQAYERKPWKIVDVPGIMNNKVDTETAIREAKKAHGHIFVVDGQPYGPEMELFDAVHHAMPRSPKIIFVNKFDKLMVGNTSADVQLIKREIERKMKRYINSPQDIVYGSAARVVNDQWVRQELPQLLDRMYADVGTLGAVMVALDPANRANDVVEAMRDKIFELRANVARRVIYAFAMASVGTAFIPFGTLVVTPGLLASMVFVIFRIMGRKENRETSQKVAVDLLQALGQELGVFFTAGVIAEMALEAANVLGPVGYLFAVAGDLAALSIFKFRRATILGETTLTYIRNDLDWGEQGRHAAIMEARKTAKGKYDALRKMRGLT